MRKKNVEAEALRVFRKNLGWVTSSAILNNDDTCA